MAQKRVYELAKELGIESRVLIAELLEMREFVRSASSTVSPAVVSRLRDRLATRSEAAPQSAAPRHRDAVPARPTQTRASPSRQESAPFITPLFEDELYDESRPEWDDLVTAKEAAFACGIQPSTIRQWVRRGYLQIGGYKRREHLYIMGDVVEALRMANQRKPPLPRLHLPISSKDLERQISAKEAADLLGVAASTIRMWIARGHLVPVNKASRPQLFTVESVVRASRRRRPVNSRRPVGPWAP